MNYFWTFCPKCECQITIQYSEHAAGLTGSLRRWSRDRAVNDGRSLQVPRGEMGEDGGFRAACVCGESIPVRVAEVQRAATEL